MTYPNNGHDVDTGFQTQSYKLNFFKNIDVTENVEITKLVFSLPIIKDHLATGFSDAKAYGDNTLAESGSWTTADQYFGGHDAGYYGMVGGTGYSASASQAVSASVEDTWIY